MYRSGTAIMALMHGITSERKNHLFRRSVILLILVLIVGLTACSSGSGPQDEPLVVYSGRAESLIGPLIEAFEQERGIEVDVRWGNTSELAATLLEEGENSPADVFFAQDPGGLGAVSDMLAPLPEEITSGVDPAYRGSDGEWVGVSGRSRTLVYNTEKLQVSDLPETIQDLTDPKWTGRIGWSPTNSSFQTMVTAMRIMWGEEATREWLEGVLANDPVPYDNNTAIVAAVGAGEIDVGLVNHYYVYRFLEEEGDDFAARNHFFSDGGPASIVMVAGIGRLASSDQAGQADEFIQFLLSSDAQDYFANETAEYPLAAGILPNPDLPPLDELDSPAINLSDLADLRGTVELLQEVGALP
jgi:iron(III) transport system substrate-binding protein